MNQAIRSPKVLIATPYFPPHAGGTENYVLNIGKRLVSEHGWRVVIVTSTEGPLTIDTVEGMRVYRLPYHCKLSNTPMGYTWLTKIRGIMARERPDIVNVHTPVPYMADLAPHFVGNTPLIVTYHTGKSIGQKGLVIDAITTVYENTLVNLPLRRANAIISSSDFVRNTFLTPYKHKTRTIAPGVDLEFFTPGKKSASKIPRLLFVGSLNKSERYKGLQFLLGAVQHITQQGRAVHLSVVGDGDNRAEYEQLTKTLGISAHVTFHGKVFGTALRDTYREATIFVHPSLFDSCPLVILEAMGCGTPVIGTNGSGIKYLVEHNRTGLLFPPADSVALAKTITRLLDDPALRKRLSAAARNYVKKRHDWDVQAHQTNKLYHEELDRHGAFHTKLKVLVLAPYYLPHVGGVEKYAHDICVRLARTYGWDVVLVTSAEHEDSVQRTNEDGIVVYRLPYWFKLSNTPFSGSWPRELKRIIAKEKPDVINGHTPVPYMADIGARIAKNIPFVLTYHNDLIKDNRTLQTLARAYETVVVRRTLKLADTIIVSSETYAKNSTMLAPHRAKSVTITPGVDTRRFHPGVDTTQVRKPFGTDPVVLFVGQLDRTHNHKGLDVLIHAFTLVRAHVPDAHLVVVGRGDNIAEYKTQAAREFITAAVTFVGFVPEEQLPSYYAACDVTVLPSKNASEGFGMVLVEAGSSGRPVIGSNIGGIPTVIKNGETGLLVPPNDSVKLAKAIITVLSDKAYAKKLGAQGRELTKAHFSWDSKAEEYAETLKNEVNR